MLENKIREAQSREEGQVEAICSLSEVVPKVVDGQLALNVRGVDYQFIDNGLVSLCRLIRIPYSYLVDLPINLQLKNLVNGLSVAKDVKIFVNRRGCIRGVCSKSYITEPLSVQLQVLANSLTLKYSLDFFQIFDEKAYIILGFSKFLYEKFKPALYLRLSDIGGKEEIICGIYHESGVFLPLVEPSLYLNYSQSYAKYSVDTTKSVLETMQKVIEDGEDQFISSVLSAEVPIENIEEWTKSLALTSIPKSLVKKLREREFVSKFVLCEMLMTESSSLRNYYDLLIRFSRELNTEFVDLWLA